MNCVYAVANLKDVLIQQTEPGIYLMMIFYLTLIKIEKQTSKHISLHGWQI